MPETRDDVRRLNRTRMAKRTSLLAGLDRAKVDLHPRNVASKWVERQIGALKAKTGRASGLARQNAPMLGAAACALLLFSARKPIFEFIRRFREKRASNKDDVA